MLTTIQMEKLRRFALALLLNNIRTNESIAIGVLVQAQEDAGLTKDENVLHGVTPEDIQFMLTHDITLVNNFDELWSRIQDTLAAEFSWSFIEEKCQLAFEAGNSRIERRLAEFVDDVERAGGVFTDADATWRLKGDPEWSDLALTYLHACNAIGKQPMIEEEEDDEV